MKAEVVLFKDLAIGTLFIQAIDIPNYHVFQKTMPSSAEVYGSGKNIFFDDMQKVIVVTEISFGELSGGQFAFSSVAKESKGIIVPFEVFIKRPTPFSGNGSAEHVDISQPCQPVYIHCDTRVINLGYIFNFRNITVATFNT